MKEILIGSSDFGKLMQTEIYCVDKSLLIKAFIDGGDEVTLITRPRRWGKSFNLTMLHYFFEDSEESASKKDLFKDLKIAQEKTRDAQPQTYIEKYQGKSPVILLSFKDIGKKNNFSEVKACFAVAISEYCEKLKENKKVSDYLAKNKEDRLVKDFNNFLNKKADDATLENSLSRLSYFLYEAYSKKRVYIFIDEYDNILNKNFGTPHFNELSEFMKTFFSAGLKDNSYLEKGLMTGILCISQSSMLSGLNNLRVYTVLNEEYAPYFGFTEEEVNVLLQYYNLEKHSKGIKDWYNGYNIGDAIIYNPWSIMNCVKDALNKKEELVLKNYWAESGANDLIQETLVGADNEIKEQLQILAQSSGQLLDVEVDTKVHFDHLAENSDAFWSLLLATGYLTAINVIPAQDTEYKCNLKIPNQEVRGIFENCVKKWLDKQKVKYMDYWKYLVAGDVDAFGRELKNFLESTASSRDIKNSKTQLENFYHGFMLGLSFGIRSHIVKSNVESGYGYYDLLIKPKVKKPESLGIILEFKIPEKKETLAQAARRGLQQAVTNKYPVELEHEGYQDILVIGISFVRKNISLSSLRGKNPKELNEKFKRLKRLTRSKVKG